MWRASLGQPTPGGTGARNTRSRGPAPQAPRPKRTPGAPGSHSHPHPHPQRTPSTPGTPASHPHAHSPMTEPHHSPTPWPDARAIAARAAVKEAAHTAPVMRPLSEALGQVLAAPLAALTDLPPFDTSAMDGWALSGPGPWRLPTDEEDQGHGILAGHGEAAPLPDGHAVRIATGARVPPGATAVLRSEYGTDAGDGWLHASPAHPVVLGQDIRTRGQECRSGDQLLPAGTLVTPAVLGLAAAAGYDELPTVRRPRVEVLVLGDELLTEGLPYDGRIRDALGPMVGPWLRALGAELSGTRRLADEADAVYAAVAESSADVVVTTGGTAAGPLDHVHPTLRRLGAELLVDGVAVRPGHPMLLARLAPVGPEREGPGPEDAAPGSREPGSPEPGSREPGSPEPGSPGSGSSGPGSPGPGSREPGSSGRGSPEPGSPGPGSPEPGSPGPRKPEPGDSGPGSSGPARPESSRNAESPRGAEGRRSPSGPARHLVGLPGNPLAAVSGLLTLAEPLLRTLTGRPAPAPGPAPLAEAVQGHPRDTRLVPVAFRQDMAVPLRFNGPAMLRGIAVADGLAVIPPGGAKRGAEVEVLDLPWSASATGQAMDTDPAADRSADRSAGRPAGGAADRSADRPADRQGGRATGRVTDRRATGRMTGRQTAGREDDEDISPQEGPA
ncbi:molybdopterin-binding protein [Streptomyces hygroscopicus]|uniref:molybdopterin molybdotransferase MoeA n=1 Tax=Streptomyces hygroscopicus TaxID=1912 RepID=UPI00099ECC5A